MSAGAPVVHSDLDELAPKFHLAVVQAIEACERAGFDAVVHEALRSDELQELYYRRGRPPTRDYPHPVTNARSALYSWHGYGLAVDVISRSRGWFHPLKVVNPTPENLAAERHRAAEEGARWFREVAAIFKAHECDWGGDWRPRSDPPHFQWGRLKPSPSDRARKLYADGGMDAVWRAVSAA
jgi:peptidoglycan LD-endopeptidase CwlK